MGGEIRWKRSGFSVQAASSASQISLNTGSIRWVTESGPSELAKKLVRHDTMTTVDSARTLESIS